MSKEEAERGFDLDNLANRLTASDDYRVLRRVPRPEKILNLPSKGTRCALILDTETTGLNILEDEVIEIGFLLVNYFEGEITSVRDLGNEMREPGSEIPIEVQKLTGITFDSLKGKKINKEKVQEAISLANIVIAHNASFDRPMCERLFPEFQDKPWACSLKEIDWAGFGFESSKLKYLLLESGYFYEGHRALDDCAALMKLLSLPSPTGNSFFENLMESARLPSYEFSVKSPYDLRIQMRSMGYRWSSFDAQSGGRWCKTVRYGQLEQDENALMNLAGRGVSYVIREQDAFARYRHF